MVLRHASASNSCHPVFAKAMRFMFMSCPTCENALMLINLRSLSSHTQEVRNFDEEYYYLSSCYGPMSNADTSKPTEEYVAAARNGRCCHERQTYVSPGGIDIDEIKILVHHQIYHVLPDITPSSNYMPSPFSNLDIAASCMSFWPSGSAEFPQMSCCIL